MDRGYVSYTMSRRISVLTFYAPYVDTLWSPETRNLKPGSDASQKRFSCLFVIMIRCRVVPGFRWMVCDLLVSAPFDRPRPMPDA